MNSQPITMRAMHAVKRIRLPWQAAAWLIAVAAAAVLTQRFPGLLQPQNLSLHLADAGIWLWLFYGLLSIACAITLVPSMPLVFAVAWTHASNPLQGLLIAIFGVLCSSLAIYFLAPRIGLTRAFAAHPALAAAELRIQRHGAPLLALWSFMPFLPTDLGCYVAASARLPIARYLAATLFGEGLLCAMIVFGFASFI